MSRLIAYLRLRGQLRLQVLALLPAAGRGLAGAAIAANVASGIAPVGFVVATSVMLSRLPGATASGWGSADGRALVWAIVAAGLLLAIQQTLAPVLGVLGQRVARRVDLVVRDRLAAAATASAGIAALEDQELLDLLSEASNGFEHNPHTPGRAVAGLISLINRYLPVVLSAVVVAYVFSVLGAVGLLTGALLIRYGTRRGLVEESKAWTANVANFRESSYFRDLALEAGAGKELRLFGLVPWLQNRQREARARSWAMFWPLRHRIYTAEMGWYAIGGAVVSAVVLAVLGHRAASGEITAARTALVLQAAVIVIRVGIQFFESDSAIEFGLSSFTALRTFELESARRYGAAAGPTAAIGSTAALAGDAVEGIRFEGVSFAYPGSTAFVLRDFDLEIPTGHSLAVVGLNGAGKTTLLKLLARLYEPTAGRITVGGVDLRDLDLGTWRRRIAAIFQDFIHYELSAEDNIGFGSIGLLGDDAAVQRAAERAGADELIGGLPKGLSTVLSGRYSDGVDLSGGQWQRVALARALFALEGGASLLILDEPTANLDIRAETELFDRFIELTAGVTTILISHRFSTVRRADRIAVIEYGHVVEQGSHESLLAENGRYAELFRLQSARFSADSSAETGEAEGS